jgi:cytoskeletal protein RodZ
MRHRQRRDHWNLWAGLLIVLILLLIIGFIAFFLLRVWP